MVNLNISTVLILTLFISVYGITFSTYSYISSLSTVQIAHTESEDETNRFQRDIVAPDLWVKNITLNKCCAHNQILNAEHQCESQEEYKTFQPSEIIEKLEFFVVDDHFKSANINNSRISFKFNYVKPRRLENLIVVNWVLNDAKVKNNYLFLQEDGSLIEVDSTRTRIEQKFSPNSYCLDENNYYGSGLIAFIQPCLEHICLQKCCPKNGFYNTIQDKCSADSPVEYIPQLFFTTSLSTKDIPSYFLIGNPKCTAADSAVRIVTNPNETVYLQEDGYLLVIDDNKKNYYYYDNNSYCVDLFSNGIENPYVSGFYCKNEANFLRPADVDVKVLSNKPTRKPTLASRMNKIIKMPTAEKNQTKSDANVTKTTVKHTHPKPPKVSSKPPKAGKSDEFLRAGMKERKIFDPSGNKEQTKFSRTGNLETQNEFHLRPIERSSQVNIDVFKFSVICTFGIIFL